MVLLNYEREIEKLLGEQAEKFNDPRFVSACTDKDFKEFMIKLYEYCEEINIIEQRMNILAKETAKLKGLKPKLLDSEVIKIEQKTKQISSYYSIFLFKQPKFKIASEESTFFEMIIKIILAVLEKCFTKDDFIRLKKQINRLIRTNTFNKKICWDQFLDEKKGNHRISERKKKLAETNFREFRRNIVNEKSEIRPYVNNRSSFRTKFTRSPMISLLFPTSEYMSFKLSRRNMRSMTK